MLTLAPQELALKQGCIRPPIVEDCSDIRRDYKRLTALPHGTINKLPPHDVGNLTEDEIAIYKEVLQQWIKAEETSLNVSLQTYPLDPFSEAESMSCGCLKNFDAEVLAVISHSFHKLPRRILPRRNMRLVDMDENSRSGASDTRSSTGTGSAPNIAIADIASGVFYLSEIAFDRAHRHALVSYSFWCGMLCGSGMTIVFEKIGAEWRRAKVECGGWIS